MKDAKELDSPPAEIVFDMKDVDGLTDMEYEGYYQSWVNAYEQVQEEVQIGISEFGCMALDDLKFFVVEKQFDKDKVTEQKIEDTTFDGSKMVTTQEQEDVHETAKDTNDDDYQEPKWEETHESEMTSEIKGGESQEQETVVHESEKTTGHVGFEKTPIGEIGETTRAIERDDNKHDEEQNDKQDDQTRPVFDRKNADETSEQQDEEPQEEKREERGIGTHSEESSRLTQQTEEDDEKDKDKPMEKTENCTSDDVYDDDRDEEQSPEESEGKQDDEQEEDQECTRVEEGNILEQTIAKLEKLKCFCDTALSELKKYDKEQKTRKKEEEEGIPQNFVQDKRMCSLDNFLSQFTTKEYERFQRLLVSRVLDKANQTTCERYGKEVPYSDLGLDMEYNRKDEEEAQILLAQTVAVARKIKEFMDTVVISDSIKLENILHEVYSMNKSLPNECDFTYQLTVMGYLFFIRPQRLIRQQSCADLLASILDLSEDYIQSYHNSHSFSCSSKLTTPNHQWIVH